MADYRQQIIEGLNKVIKDELSAASNYHCIANNTKDATLAEELRDHGDEEFTHYKLLIEFIFNHGLESEITFGVDPHVINDIKKDTETILSLVQKLEKEAISDYSKLSLLARENDDLETEKFFTNLLQEEQGHFDDLAQYTGEKRSLSSVLSNLSIKK